MASSILHILSEVECQVFLFDEDKGTITPGKYFHLEVRKGEQDLLFVSTGNNTMQYRMQYKVEENDCDYKLQIERKQFYTFSPEFLETLQKAKSGDAEAQCRLGECYAHGTGVEENKEEAVKWFRKAAEQGNAEAQYHLGECYYDGEGVEQDIEEAVEWYREAAEQGYAPAQYMLGLCYYDGEGTGKDEEEAVKWYRKAAEQGDGYAQFMLGRCYQYGKGVKKNRKVAVGWFRKAAEQGHVNAKRKLEDLEAKIAKKAPVKRVRVISAPSTPPPHYLFFDTETTGIPTDFNAPASYTWNWPRLVQLGWILSDKEGHVISSGNEIIRPDGFTIPADAAKVHGITTEEAKRRGKPLREVVDSFLKDAKRAKVFVGHNISFDQKVVGAELCRLGLTDTVSTRQSICTMKSSTNYCKIPGNYGGYKWPQLKELYRKLFGRDFADAHDAMADIEATKECFFELVRLGVIQ